MKKELKPLKSVDLLIIHCVGNRCDRPFSTESLINTGLARFGQVSYHWYIKRDGSIESLLPENVQGVHAKHYNHCSLGIVYEGGLTPKGRADDTRTELRKPPCVPSWKSLLRPIQKPISWATVSCLM